MKNHPVHGQWLCCACFPCQLPSPPPARSSPAQGVALVVVVVASLRVFRIFEMDCLRRFSQGGQLSCH